MKILVTSIGTGKYDKDTQEVSYLEADYYIPEDSYNIHKGKYVFEALKHFYEIDQCIFVGTCGSDWASLYNYIFEESNNNNACERNDDYYNELVDIILLKYGLDTQELLTNFMLISQISEMIHDGDEIYFDLTHSFRSLAVYEFLVVNYLKNALKKDIKIQVVSYAMFEIARENNGLTPIVDLSELLNVIDWINAVEEYKRHGTAYLCLDLLRKNKFGNMLTEEDKKALKMLSEPITTNNIDIFKSFIRNLEGIINTNDGANEIRNDIFIVDIIFTDLHERFRYCLDDDFLFQMEFAKWHIEKKRYMVAANTVVEAFYGMVSRVTEELHEQGSSRITYLNGEDRKILKQFPKVRELIANFNQVRLIRNSLVHSERELNKQLLNQLPGTVNRMYNTYKETYFGDENRNKISLFRCAIMQLEVKTRK